MFPLRFRNAHGVIRARNDVAVVGLEIECRYSIYPAARIICEIGESRDFTVSRLFDRGCA